MEDQVITTTAQTTEPTIVESANTSAENTAGLFQVVENPAVVEQATPMDANVTYNNLPKIEYQPNMDSAQNAVNMYVQTEHAKNQTDNVGTAMDKFLNQDYDYDKNEAGTYWVAGAINDNNTQMSFLETLINEEMYDEMDLQKYYYDTNLATARAYAAQKKKEVAYGFYRAAQERAFAEGELTGWYMPAEGRYMLGQYTVAQNTLENPDATEEEKAKATRVTTAAEKWFAANQLTTRGIKCLAMMNYEENVRHNKIMGDLQLQAAKVAANQAAAGAKSAELSLREFKFETEEMEMDTGFDFSYEIGLDDEEFIGHNPKDYPKYTSLRGYETLEEMLLNDPEHFNEVLTATSEENIKNILGDKDYTNAKNRFKGYKGNTILEESIKQNNGNILSETGLTPQGKFGGKNKPKDIDPNDTNVYRFYSKNTETGEPELRIYYKNKYGSYKQLDSVDYELDNGKFLRETLDSSIFTDTKLTYNGEEVRVGPITDMNDFDGAFKIENYRLDKDQAKTIVEKQKEGWQLVEGAISVDNINAYIVMKRYNSETKEWEYAEVSNKQGDFKRVTQLYDIHFLEITSEVGDDIGYVTANGSVKSSIPYDNIKETNLEGDTFGEGGFLGIDMKHTDDYIASKFEKIKTTDGTEMYAYAQPDGSILYAKRVPSDEGVVDRLVVISSEEASKSFDLNTFEANKTEYNNGIHKTKEINKDEVIKNKTTKDNKMNTNKKESSSISAGNANAKNGEEYNPELTSVHYEGVQNVTMEDEPTILNDMETKRREEEKNKSNKVNEVPITYL